jgi:Domain of unknown function (DUF4177)
MIWEYKTALNDVTPNIIVAENTRGFDVIETDQFLNIMGQDNWELVDVNPIISNGITTKFVYFFKRPKSNISANLPDIGFDIDHNGITGSQR